MIDFPLPLADIFGHWGSYVVYLIVGLLFGFILENAGFGNFVICAFFGEKTRQFQKMQFSSLFLCKLFGSRSDNEA